MPCSAKKSEAKRGEFYVDDNPDTDYVVTTVGLARMIKEAGIDFVNLENEWFDMPFGTKTGAGVIFGASGGVMTRPTRAALNFPACARAKYLKKKPLRWGTLKSAPRW